ncbi:cysteine desulfurase [Waddlia chondrophila 2032/99]|uniref:Cysteine desulfurase n=2 Tax=Waddlia chondrophila TaxID=71667 RepID=D6YVZ8_WADCW|nr:cysteine desulfurase family protein [Waddlia chondrophila]ADI38309.1 cysteine desulfurase [Waddlia chondrophila WSU 86-1044]CCB91390.1 cysteine desulfurase [Waddlia chondrophila 2032/99]
MNKAIYLDHNANTFVAPSVIEAVADYMREVVGNPSSIHQYGRNSKKYYTQSRDYIARYLDVRPDEIIFTSGGTEGANLVIRGIFDKNNGKGHVITSTAEHSCVYKTVKMLEKRGIEATYLKPGLYGAPSAVNVKSAIRSDTCLIAIMSVNNETGVKADISSIAQIAQEAGVPFFVDGVAQFGRDTIKIPDGVSAMSFSGQKIHAPLGVGFCFVRKSFKLDSHMTGGGHQFGRRAGTENVSGIVGLAEAVRLLENELPEGLVKMQSLRDHFEEQLLAKLEGTAINGEGIRVANTSNLYFPEVDGEALLQRLDLAGVAASHGSACSSGGLEPSRVLLEMGYPLSRVRSSLRFSICRHTTREEIDQAIQVIVNAVNELLFLQRGS